MVFLPVHYVHASTRLTLPCESFPDSMCADLYIWGTVGDSIDHILVPQAIAAACTIPAPWCTGQHSWWSQTVTYTSCCYALILHLWLFLFT